MTNKNKNSWDKCTYNDHGVYCINSNFGGGRGLCNTHFSQCTYHVKRGKKTWEDYEKLEMCRKKLSQDEKNINQMHPHKKYKIAPKL